ncbi:unnamed protein product [Fusarium venenatum]|uniref:Uncharacterized protein n=1 Tax=Fusarium venenatum TaxID=56646 RepID=A0A2L2T6C5_9HYPO|nr:uncharacterized protein FVRRES_13680 [Fusarium venenatum]CEI41657.1 unnamed protein product [Fusarium venenatum]
MIPTSTPVTSLKGVLKMRGNLLNPGYKSRSDGKWTVKTLQLPVPNNDTVSKVRARDGDKCIITGLQSSLFHPLIVTPIPRIWPDFHDLLSNTGNVDGPQNYLLVRRFAALAFSQGYFRFKFSWDPNVLTSSKRFLNFVKYSIWQVLVGGSDKPSIIDKLPMTRRGCFKDYSESGNPFPHKSLLEVFSRFAKANSWYRVSTVIVLKQQKPPPVSTKPPQSFSYNLSEYGAGIYSAFCRLMPSRVRAQIYRGMWHLGAYLYGLSSSSNV